MKHVKAVTKGPAIALEGIPPTIIIPFIQSLLDALLALFQAKESANAPQ